MSNERFTQGEWAFQETDYGAVVLCGQADIETGKNVIYMQEAVHDACLIAAAPDMYRALRDALTLLEENVLQIEWEWGSCRSFEEIEAAGDLPDEILAARAALAKADGRCEMECVHCGEQLPDEPHDTTFCNYNSPRYSAGTHTGNIYRCEHCEEDTIELVQEGGKLESWSY